MEMPGKPGKCLTFFLRHFWGRGCLAQAITHKVGVQCAVMHVPPPSGSHPSIMGILEIVWWVTWCEGSTLP